MLETEKCYCPYCGERIEVVIDISESIQSYIEDCSVCCRPINLRVSTDYDTGKISLQVSSDNE